MGNLSLKPPVLNRQRPVHSGWTLEPSVWGLRAEADQYHHRIRVTKELKPQVPTHFEGFEALIKLFPGRSSTVEC